MKHQLIVAGVSVLLSAMLGCENRSAPVNVGLFDVDSDKKVATGQALGIEFEVAGTSKVEVISGTLGPPNYEKKAEIKFADDLRVELENADDETSATFRLNGKDFGIS